jgi:hypothetical protein
MVHDSWLKVRISGDLVVGLRAKYGRGVSKAVRGMIERDLGVEKKSDAGALVKGTVGEIGTVKDGKLSARDIQEMVNRLQSKKK